MRKYKPIPRNYLYVHEQIELILLASPEPLTVHQIHNAGRDRGWFPDQSDYHLSIRSVLAQKPQKFQKDDKKRWSLRSKTP